MLIDSRLIAEAYTTQIPTPAVVQQQPTTRLPIGVAAPSEEEDKKAENKKPLSGIKDWIRLPFIDTPFKARMAAVLIVELINTMTQSQELKELVLKEIRVSNRLHRRK